MDPRGIVPEAYMGYGSAAHARAPSLEDDLWVVLGILELLAGRADLSCDARALAEAALVAAEQAAEKARAREHPPLLPGRSLPLRVVDGYTLP